ncbi:MAG: LodA/GoxA family CTQ-dependent oxidase [Minicystis sp.]
MDARTTPTYAGKGGEIVPSPSYPRSFPADHFPDALAPRGPIDTLGEISTDERGRLVVAGGYGRAVGMRKADGTPYPLFAAVNNDGWFDDTSDGPVSAVLCFEDGSTVEAQGAWFICTDPGYAPQTLNVVSLWDEVYNTFIRDMLLRPEVYRDGAYDRGYEPYFDSELKPVFRAAALTRWNTNLPPMAIRAHDAIGRIGPEDAPGDTLIAGLAFIRNPNNPGEAGVGVPLMPLALGDAGNSFLQPTFTQYFFLEQWSQGKARKDTTEMPFGPGEALDRASLYNCLGGRFSPGIDMTFIVRDDHLWRRDWTQAGPFRIRAKALDYEKAREDEPFLTEGYIPLRESAVPDVEPGDTSKFMSVPWHTDYNSCATHNPDPNPVNNTTLFWSWPAQRPVAVHVAADVRGGVLGAQRYSVRGPGTASPNPAAQGRYQQYLSMVENWSRLGVVIQGSRITDGGSYSSDHFLEVQSQLDEPPVPPWPQNTLNDD